MSNKFAKLFDTANGQFLVTLGAQADDDTWPMTFRAEHDLCIPEVTNSYETEEARQGQFDGIDQAKAEHSAAEMVRMVDNLLGPIQEVEA